MLTREERIALGLGILGAGALFAGMAYDANRPGAVASFVVIGIIGFFVASFNYISPEV